MGTAPLSVDRNGYHVHWDAVPAWLCTQSGEPLFEGREVDVIQDAIKALDRESGNVARHPIDRAPRCQNN